MEDLSIHERIISGMCRLCLTSNETLIDMFSFSSQLESTIAIAVTKCTSIHIKKHNELPSTICESCYMQLIKTENFQRQALKSEKTLQMYLEQLREDDKQNLFGSSDVSRNHFIETNVVNQNKKDSTNCEEIKPEIKYLENGYEEFEMDIVERKIDPLETRSHMKWDVHSSGKDSAFNPNQIVKSEPVTSDSDLFGVDTEVLNDFSSDQKIIKPGNEVSNDKMIASYQCDVCKKCFNNSNILRKHQRLHTGKKIYQCDVCNKNFSSSSNVNYHQRSHSDEKSYQCNVCHKSFHKSFVLRMHERIHTGEKPYQCDVCNKSFSSSGNLKLHQRSHTGEKPYQCDVCNKSFSQSGILRIHERVHTGEKPYQCDICNKCFTQLSSLNRHMPLHISK